MILLTKFVNGCVLAEIAKPGKKGFPSLDAPGKSRKHHDYLRVHQRRKRLVLATKPCLVDLPHGCGRIRALRVVYH